MSKIHFMYKDTEIETFMFIKCQQRDKHFARRQTHLLPAEMNDYL